MCIRDRVISPLISLMMDQVKALNQAGIHAAYINSALTEGQISKALYNAKEGRYKIIYVAPERLETDSFLSFAAQTEISMLTVDEAHCISQWGQDFRPSYLNIVSFIEQLPDCLLYTSGQTTAVQPRPRRLTQPPQAPRKERIREVRRESLR